MTQRNAVNHSEEKKVDPFFETCPLCEFWGNPEANCYKWLSHVLERHVGKSTHVGRRLILEVSREDMIRSGAAERLR